jgi:hypothetical protein
MKKIFAVLMAALLIGGLLPAVSFASQIVDSGACGDNVTWTLDDDGLLTVSGSGAMYDYSYEITNVVAPWSPTMTAAQPIRTVVVENGVTSIGNEAFLACADVESVYLPESVESIGGQAFSQCSSLREVAFGNGLVTIGEKAFFGCTALETIALPDSVTTLSSSVFHGCAELREATVGSGMTYIGDSMFYGCSNLRSIVIPEGITEILPYAFYGCFSLTDVTLPASLASVDGYAFGGCAKLHILCHKQTYACDYTEENGYAFGLLDGSESENTLSGSVSGMDWSINRVTAVLTISANGDMPSFLSSKSVPWAQDVIRNYVHTAVISEGVTSIGNLSFFGCDALSQVFIPEGVTSVGASAFYDCAALEEIRFPDSVVMIGAYACHGCSALTAIDFGSGVKYIGAHAFSGCSSLEEAALPIGLTTISDFLFADCVRLTEVALPVFATSVGVSAFARSGLMEVILPSTVKTLSSRAFENCPSLYSVTFFSSTCRIGTNVVPAGTVIFGYLNSDAERYAAANDLEFREIGSTHVHNFIVTKSVPATCGKTGMNTLICRCGEKKIEILPRTGLHIQGAAEHVIVTPATCATAGEERIKVRCEVCGQLLLDETVEIPATGEHIAGEIVETVMSPATCTEKGWMLISVSCAVCGGVLTETQASIPMIPHPDANGDQFCDVCGYTARPRCNYCGQYHDDSAIGKLQQSMHYVLYFLLSNFGLESNGAG